MKVELENLRLGIAAVSNEAQVGIMSKSNPMLWKHKINVDNDFIHAVVTRWKNKKEAFVHNGYRYEITVKATKIVE